MIHLRTGKKQDVPAIAALLVATWKDSYKDFLPTSFLNNLDIEKQIERHQRIMTDGAQYLVCENETQIIVGFASYGIQRSGNQRTMAELYTLYVDLQYQKRGIGQLLVDAVTSKVEKEFETLSVIVMEQNPYRRFYLKNGFTEIGREEMTLAGFRVSNLILCKSLQITRSN